MLIKGFEDYEIFEDGKIYSNKSKKYLKFQMRNGYYSVELCKDGKRYKKDIHRLLGEHFIDGYFEGAIINHIDGNKLNNDLDNLEWVTFSYNLQHALNTGLRVIPSGDDNPNTKLSSTDKLQILDLYEYGFSQYDIAKMYGVSQNTISKKIRTLRAKRSETIEKQL